MMKRLFKALVWPTIITTLVFLGLLYLVTHVSMPPG
jgi:hypothetical protein